MTWWLNPKLWAGLALAAALVAAGWILYGAGQDDRQKDFDAYKLDQQELRILADRANRKTEQTWQDAANQKVKAKDETILNINARLADALGRLSDRPARPAADIVPANPRTAASGTGAGLYREDGQFLAGEAAAAARIAAERDACYAVQAELRAAQR